MGVGRDGFLGFLGFLGLGVHRVHTLMKVTFGVFLGL